MHFGASFLTFSLRASSFSSLSLLRNFSRRRSRCSTANSASVYVRSTLWRCIIPRVHPPRLGTLVKPWHRGKKNTVTWSKVTLPRRALLDFLRMDVAVDGERVHLEYILSKKEISVSNRRVLVHSLEQPQLLSCATRWCNAPPLEVTSEMCANPAEQTVKGHPSDSLP